MKQVEKNDVAIGKLFSWGKDAEISFGGKKLKFYIRIVGDADVNRARVQALRASGDLRRKFKDTNSDEYLAYIVDKDSITKDWLVNVILQGFYQNMLNEAAQLVDVPSPKELEEDATLEEQEAHQKEIDEYPAKFESAIKEKMECIYTRESTKLNEISFDELYNSYQVSTINNMCESEMMRVFKELCTYYGCYKDGVGKERLFSTFDEFDNLPASVKSEFTRIYGELDLNSDELKK